MMARNRRGLVPMSLPSASFSKDRYRPMRKPAKPNIRPPGPKACIGRVEKLWRNFTVIRSSTTLMVRDIPYLDLPNLRAWWFVSTSVIDAPTHEAMAGMKRCISP